MARFINLLFVVMLHEYIYYMWLNKCQVFACMAECKCNGFAWEHISWALIVAFNSFCTAVIAADCCSYVRYMFVRWHNDRCMILKCTLVKSISQFLWSFLSIAKSIHILDYNICATKKRSWSFSCIPFCIAKMEFRKICTAHITAMRRNTRRRFH